MPASTALHIQPHISNQVSIYRTTRQLIYRHRAIPARNPVQAKSNTKKGGGPGQSAVAFSFTRADTPPPPIRKCVLSPTPQNHPNVAQLSAAPTLLATSGRPPGQSSSNLATMASRRSHTFTSQLQISRVTTTGTTLARERFLSSPVAVSAHTFSPVVCSRVVCSPVVCSPDAWSPDAGSPDAQVRWCRVCRVGMLGYRFRVSDRLSDIKRCLGTHRTVALRPRASSTTFPEIPGEKMNRQLMAYRAHLRDWKKVGRGHARIHTCSTVRPRLANYTSKTWTRSIAPPTPQPCLLGCFRMSLKSTTPETNINRTTSDQVMLHLTLSTRACQTKLQSFDSKPAVQRGAFTCSRSTPGCRSDASAIGNEPSVTPPLTLIPSPFLCSETRQVQDPRGIHRGVADHGDGQDGQ